MFEALFICAPLIERHLTLGGHPNPAIGGRLKTGHFR